jgi:catechol 2,3-dioxygenase
MHIGHVALRVPDIDASAEHAIATLGLVETPCEIGGTRLLSANTKHHELQLISADACSLDHVGLEVEADQLAGLRERIAASGFAILTDEPQEPGLAHAFRCAGPNGITFEIYAGMTHHPQSVARRIGGHAHKLGHLTFTMRSTDQLLPFLLDTLGFRVSDELGPFYWLRCDTDHHGIALGGGFETDRLHHYAWQLQGWEGMRRYLDDLAVARSEVIYGPGRHGPGFNIFTYLVDPAGVVIEAYADLQTIDNESTYQPIDWSMVPHPLNLWGPEGPADFGDHGAPLPGDAADGGSGR